MPPPDIGLPIKFRRELFSLLSARIALELNSHGVSRREVLRDFESWRKKRAKRSRLDGRE